jgi:hypothetical protein
LTRAYTMQAVQHAADRAVALVGDFLRAEVAGSRVHDVQADPRFQHRGVDLLWERSDADVLGIEVKGDRQGGRRGTYFLELISNLEKDTPDCFLYSAADLLVYDSLDRRELHLLPVQACRSWFLARARDFPLRRTQTRIGAHHYTTVGASVPARRVLRDVEGARRIRLSGNPPPAA